MLYNGYEGVVYLTNYSYDTALVGVTEDNREVYDFEKMVEWLVETEGLTHEEPLSGLNTIPLEHCLTLVKVRLL